MFLLGKLFESFFHRFDNFLCRSYCFSICRFFSRKHEALGLFQRLVEWWCSVLHTLLLCSLKSNLNALLEWFLNEHFPSFSCLFDFFMIVLFRYLFEDFECLNFHFLIRFAFVFRIWCFRCLFSDWEIERNFSLCCSGQYCPYSLRNKRSINQKKWCALCPFKRQNNSSQNFHHNLLFFKVVVQSLFFFLISNSF